MVALNVLGVENPQTLHRGGPVSSDIRFYFAYAVRVWDPFAPMPRMNRTLVYLGALHYRRAEACEREAGQCPRDPDQHRD